MGSCCSNLAPEEEPVDPANPHGKPIQHDPNWEGPVKKRSCTDVICLLLFLVLLGAWGGVAFLAFQEGDVNKLIHPTDSKGQICGGNGTLKDRPKLLFFDITECLNPAVITLGCPTPQICVKECPKKTSVSQNDIKPFCSSDDECPKYVLKSKHYLGRCIPDVGGSSDDNKTVEGVPDQKQIKDANRRIMIFMSARNFFENAITDVKETWWMIGVGLILAFLLCMLWIFLMRFFAGILIWTSLIVLFVLFSGGFGYSVYKCDQAYKSDDKDVDKGLLEVNITPDYFFDVLKLKDTWLAFSIISGIFTLIILLIFIALRKRISLAIELINQGAVVVGKHCGSIFWPVVPFVLHLVVFAWFCVIGVLLTTTGVKEYKIVDQKNCNDSTKGYNVGDTCDPESFESSDSCPDMMCTYTFQKNIFGDWRNWFNLFAFLWTMEFVTALGEFVLARTYSKWYWTPPAEKSAWKNCGCRTFSSIGTAFYHLGTLACGSLIIGIIRFIQAILNRVEKTLGKYNNELTKCLLCMCKCCLWCLEKFMRFINRNAYIICAIRSTNFCSSAKQAFSLLMRNPARTLVLNSVVSWLLWLGKLAIVAGIGVLSYFFFAKQIPIPELDGEIPNLTNGWLPTVLIVIGAYYIATSFFSVYSMAVDTLFLCLLEDLERNDGTLEKPYFGPKGLLKIVGKKQQFADEHANEHEMKRLVKEG